MRSISPKGSGAAGESEPKPGFGTKRITIGHHWAAAVGLVAIGVLYALLPTKVSIGPSWFLLAVEGVFVVPAVLATVTRHRIAPAGLRVGSFILLVIVTATLLIGIGHLLATLKRDVSGRALIISGLLLYSFNVLVSALWYYELDGGGPEKRRQSGHWTPDFLFPQQMGGSDGDWTPHFVDYLYVAFTGATAFSPTDAMPLSRRAKLLMMIEAILALVLISFVVSRAINII